MNSDEASTTIRTEVSLFGNDGGNLITRMCRCSSRSDDEQQSSSVDRSFAVLHTNRWQPDDTERDMDRFSIVETVLARCSRDCLVLVTSENYRSIGWFYVRSIVRGDSVQRLLLELNRDSPDGGVRGDRYRMSLEACYFVRRGKRLARLLSRVFRNNRVAGYLYTFTPNELDMYHRICLNFMYHRNG